MKIDRDSCCADRIRYLGAENPRGKPEIVYTSLRKRSGRKFRFRTTESLCRDPNKSSADATAEKRIRISTAERFLPFLFLGGGALKRKCTVYFGDAFKTSRPEE